MARQEKLSPKSMQQLLRAPKQRQTREEQRQAMYQLAQMYNLKVRVGKPS